MGHSRKEEIARLRRERREAKAAKGRSENVREKLVRFLIVCEGTETEPQYFKALINNHLSTVRQADIKGVGRGTVALIDRTAEIKTDLEKRNAMTFDHVWVVFDKDDFNDFNEAIEKAHKLGFQSGWTNEAFELWYCLHFEYVNTGISRSDYIEKLEEILRKKTGNQDFKYEKGNADNYMLLQKYGDEKKAKKFAEKLRALYHDKNYSAHNPCTMVDLLVEKLENPKDS